MRIPLLLFVLPALVQCSAPKAASRVKNVVVLMMENRSFDHMLGWLRRDDPRVDGLTGKESNPFDTTKPDGARVTVSSDADFVDPDPSHSIEGTTMQIFGANPRPRGAAPLMDGFVESMAGHRGVNTAADVMKGFNASSIPVMWTLAKEYALFDRWYASVPGPTEVNRAYLHSGTSHGMSHNDAETLAEGLPQKTLYDLLYEKKIDYNVFMGDFSTVLFFKRMRAVHQLDKFRLMEDFYKRAREGKLPSFSFIDPRYFTLPGIPANDQHPSHSVAVGEDLIRDVYTAVRESPNWNETALIITYDEHGGFYDHVPPPPCVNPDGINSTDPSIPFSFDRLGIRVPTIVVSPWVAKGTVVHEPPSSHFDHTSLIATLTKMWGLNGPLTKRDAAAATFEGVFEEIDAARTDCPETLPHSPIPRALETNSYWFSGTLGLNDLQEGFVRVIAAIVGDKLPVELSTWTEASAADYVITKTWTWVADLLHRK